MFASPGPLAATVAVKPAAAPKAALALLGLVAAAAAVGLPACGKPLVLVSVDRANETPDGSLMVRLNATLVDSFTSVPLSGQPLRRGYRLSSDDQKICVRLEFTGKGTTESREVAWNGDIITWTVGGMSAPMGPGCEAGAGGMGGAAGGRSGSGGAGGAGGRSGPGAAGRGGTGAVGSGGSAGGAAPSGGTTGQGGGSAGTGGALSSGGTVGSGGASGASGGRGGQPASSGGMMMAGSGGGPGGRGVGSGGATSSGGAGGLGGIPSTGGATPTGGVMGPGTGGIGATGGAGGLGGAGGHGGTGAGGMAGNGGRSGGTGGSAGAQGPSCINDITLPCTCADYCRIVDAKCASWMFYPPNECVPTCQGFGWPQVLLEDQSSGLSCRSRQLSLNNCRSAGPVGWNDCVFDRCALLCSVVARNCPDARYPYLAGDDCTTKCSAAYAFDADEDVLPMSTTRGGNDGNCRLYWATYAGRPGLTDPQRDDACAQTAMMSTACP